MVKLRARQGHIKPLNSNLRWCGTHYVNTTQQPTKCEIEALKAIWETGSVKLAAQKLGKSNKTVEYFTATLRARLDMVGRSYVDLFKWGVRSGVLTAIALTLIGCKHTTMAPNQQAKPTGTIQVAANPPSGGTVSGGGTYAINSAINLTAYPNASWLFSQWQDGLTAQTRTVVVRRGTVNFVATFKTNPPPVYGTVNLTATPINGGSVYGAGTFIVGQTVGINAVAANNWSFQQWSDGNQLAQRQIVVPNGSVLYAATFVTNQPTYINVSVGSNPTQGGVVNGGGSFPVGATVTLQAVPNPNWRFTTWNDNVTSIQRSFVIQAGMTYNYVAYFQNFGTITLTAEPPYGGTVSGGGTYQVGQLVSLAATPASTNWIFSKWQDGITNNPRTLSVVSGSVQMTATFVTNYPASQQHSANLYWNPVTNVNNYVVSYGIAPGSYTASQVTSTTNITIANLADANTYYFSVVAQGTFNGLQSVPSCEVAWKYPGSNFCSGL